MRMSEAQLEETIAPALEQGRVMSLKTYLLSEYGESTLHLLTTRILEHYKRVDLRGIAYTLTKELVINATKANLKRMIFKDLNLDIDDPGDYETGMKRFKEILEEGDFRKYKQRFRELDHWTMVTFVHSKDVLNIKVKNSFPILAIEEQRVRDKLGQARSFNSLADLLNEIDGTEGAGLGLSMICVTLNNQGIDNRAFTLKSNEYDETAAKLEIPLNDDYIPRLARY